MQRRQFLSCLGLGMGLGAATVAAPAVGAVPRGAETDFRFPSPRQAAAAGKWPGHRPGMIYLGLSAAGSVDSAEKTTGPVGLFRSFSHWGSASNEAVEIRANQAKGRLTWISYDPPVSTSGIWAKIGSGAYDADIRARAQVYAGLSVPAIVTFSHEPQGDLQWGSPANFAAAWTRIYDVWNAETGLKNAAFVPIIGDWVFNPVNHKNGHPDEYLPSGVLSRMAFLGTDLYQNPSGQDYSIRLARLIRFLDDRGRSDKMVGVGETACSDFYPGNASDWWKRSWQWAVAHSSRVGAISYFHSQNNSRPGANWLLTESAAKLNAYKASLQSTVSCGLA